MGSYFELKPEILITNIYDDNILLENQKNKADNILTLSPSINLNHKTYNNQVFFSYFPTFVKYFKYSNYNTIRHNAKIDLNHHISKYLWFDIKEVYLKSEEAYEPDQLNPNIRHSGKSYQRNAAYLGLNYQFGQEDLAMIEYNHNILDNNDENLDNALEQGPTCTLSYWFDIRNGFSLSFQLLDNRFNRQNRSPIGDDFKSYNSSLRYTHRFDKYSKTYADYKISDRIFKGQTPDYSVHNFFLGLDYAISANSTLSTGTGYYNQQIETSKDTKGILFEANITTKKDNITINVGAKKGWDESFISAESKGFTKYSSISTNIQYQISDKFNSYGKASYRENQGTDDLVDQTYEGSIGFNIEFFDWYTFSLDYTYRTRKSDLKESEYNDNRIMLNFSASKSFKDLLTN